MLFYFSFLCIKIQLIVIPVHLDPMNINSVQIFFVVDLLLSCILLIIFSSCYKDLDLCRTFLLVVVLYYCSNGIWTRCGPARGSIPWYDLEMTQLISIVYLLTKFYDLNSQGIVFQSNLLGFKKKEDNIHKLTMSLSSSFFQ